MMILTFFLVLILLLSAVGSLMSIGIKFRLVLMVAYMISYLVIMAFVVSLWFVLFLGIVTLIVFLTAFHLHDESSKKPDGNHKLWGTSIGMCIVLISIWIWRYVERGGFDFSNYQFMGDHKLLLTWSEMWHLFLTDHSLTLGIVALILLAVVVDINRSNVGNGKHQK